MADKRAVSPEEANGGSEIVKRQKTENGAIAKTSAKATENVSMLAAYNNDSHTPQEWPSRSYLLPVLTAICPAGTAERFSFLRRFEVDTEA